MKAPGGERCFDSMEIDYQLTADDLLAFHRYHAEHLPGGQRGANRSFLLTTLLVTVLCGLAFGLRFLNGKHDFSSCRAGPSPTNGTSPGLWKPPSSTTSKRPAPPDGTGTRPGPVAGAAS